MMVKGLWLYCSNPSKPTMDNSQNGENHWKGQICLKKTQTNARNPCWSIKYGHFKCNCIYGRNNSCYDKKERKLDISELSGAKWIGNGLNISGKAMR
jgi:hypothetical protein